MILLLESSSVILIENEEKKSNAYCSYWHLPTEQNFAIIHDVLIWIIWPWKSILTSNIHTRVIGRQTFSSVHKTAIFLGFDLRKRATFADLFMTKIEQTSEFPFLLEPLIASKKTVKQKEKQVASWLPQHGRATM